jgi:hypothetical protein
VINVKKVDEKYLDGSYRGRMSKGRIVTVDGSLDGRKMWVGMLRGLFADGGIFKAFDKIR